MKSSTIHNLMMAKVILAQAKPLFKIGDANAASAGIILLQDSLELIILGLLDHKGIDESISLEKLSFDQLLGELKKESVTIPKLGTLKALNKQRVISKHYGQLVEPAAARNYLSAFEKFVEITIPEVLSTTLENILLSSMLPDTPSTNHIKQAEIYRDEGSFLDCLCEIRKAFYIEYEHDFSIEGWKDFDNNSPQGILESFVRRGSKAPYYTKNREWIEGNVFKPTDYIQLDYEKIRLDAMEWGVSPVDINNIIRLTPRMFKSNNIDEWFKSYNTSYPPNAATLENCNDCLETIINVFTKKNEYDSAHRFVTTSQPSPPTTVYIGQNVHLKADQQSDVLHVIAEGFLYNMDELMNGFNAQEFFYKVVVTKADDTTFYLGGYVLKVDA